MTGAVGFVAAAAATPSMGLTVSPAQSAGSYRGVSTAAVNITTSSVLATVSGGTPPYTYAWGQVGSSAYAWTIGSSATASTSFTAQSVGPGEAASATFSITVTDAAGIQAAAPVSASAANLSTG
jgi:hypothetical protein